jgi:hypothetical protein
MPRTLTRLLAVAGAAACLAAVFAAPAGAFRLGPALAPVPQNSEDAGGVSVRI